MKIAILGDIHSNHIALEACMERIYAENVDGIAFLGDHISDCPYPQKTMEILYNIPKNYKTWFIRGNREDYMLRHANSLSDEWSYCSQSGSLLYTYENLTGSDLRFFEAMPIGMEIKLDGYEPFSICHGSMQSNSFLFHGDSQKTRDALSESATRLTICGHWHTPYVYSFEGKTIINTGSVGNPLNDRHSATFVLLTADSEGQWQYEHIYVPFDIERAVKEFYQSGLIRKADVWSRAYIAAMCEGVNYNIECVNIVKKLCKESGKDFSDESLWQKAAEILNI